MPPAPPRFSITSGCPRFIFGASMRMMRSGGPPGGEGTTMWIGLFGNGCACAENASVRLRNKARDFISSLDYFVRSDQQGCRNIDAYRFGDLQVDGQFE